MLRDYNIAYLRSVMKKSKPVFNIDSNDAIFEEAVPVLIDIALVRKNNTPTIAQQPTNSTAYGKA